MKLTVRGCSGGIGPGRRTLSLQVGEDVLVDAGSGVGDLGLDEMAAIRHVFLTHCHLDHTGFLPLLADAAAHTRPGSLEVHALPQTRDALMQHLFNGVLWPDYTRLPDPAAPYIRFSEIHPGETCQLGALRVTPLPACHSVPAVGYRLQSADGSLVCSGDTTLCDEFWQALDALPDLVHLLIECTFRDGHEAAAQRSGHMTPRLLAEGMSRLKRIPQLHIMHMESGAEDETFREVVALAGAARLNLLRSGDVLIF
jgi:ribonuclease BN (tRNA processing enzyme)